MIFVADMGGRSWYKWLLLIGIGALLVLAVLAAALVWDVNDTTVVTKYVKNDKLMTIKAGWPGTPVDQRGRFANHEHPFILSALDVLKWRLSGNPQSEEKRTDGYRPEVKDPTEFLEGDEDGILWLGHASFYIRLAGKGILIDPVFGDPWFLKRYVEVPSPIGKLKKVDYVLVSHDHRDHADEDTLTRTAQEYPDAKFYAGLGMEDVLSSWTGGRAVQTAGWFQQFALDDEKVEIYFLPVRHWCRRGLFDTNRRLWGGFVIRSANAAIYFGGDSGYGRHYRETAELFPRIDYFLIGIGAYKPRWFMEPNHNSPEDALAAFRDSGAKVMVPMHYGTFDLSDEPPGEPLRSLNEKADEMGLSGKIKTIAIGESIEIGNSTK